MLVTFSTKSYSNIMMFEETATRLLHMMGHSATIPGALLAQDVPDALSQLKGGLNIEGGKPVTPVGIHEHDDEESEPVVSLRHRALPLVELLENAVRKNADVMWK
jgi:hypothetical protein